MNCIDQFSYFEFFKTLCMVLIMMFGWCYFWGCIASRFFKNAKDTVFLDKAD